MIYKFRAGIITERGRAFIEIPFNVWEETGLKGNIPCKVTILDLSFECKLIPKGNGIYFIPVTKKTLSALERKEEYEVGMQPIDGLSRINHDSPYSKERPIRKIDGIREIPVQAGFCGHACVAMLAGVPLAEVVARMGKGRASLSKILECLDYYGISYSPKAVYPKGGFSRLPPCCIVNHDNGFVLWYKGAFCGVTAVDLSKIKSYIEILLD